MVLSPGPCVRWALVTYSAWGVLCVELFTAQRVDSGDLTHLLTSSILKWIAINVCPLKWVYGLYYLGLIKLTLTKWTSGLKRFLQRDPGLKTLIMWAQTNAKKMIELTLLLILIWTQSATLWGTNNNQLIKSDKKLAKKIKILKRLLQYGYTSNIINDEPHSNGILRFEKLASDGMKQSELARHLKSWTSRT